MQPVQIADGSDYGMSASLNEFIAEHKAVPIAFANGARGCVHIRLRSC